MAKLRIYPFVLRLGRGETRLPLHRNAEIAQRVVERGLLVGRLLAPPDDERAGHAVLSGRKLLGVASRNYDRTRRNVAPVFDRFGPRDVDDVRRTGDDGVADRSLTAWLPRHIHLPVAEVL